MMRVWVAGVFVLGLTTGSCTKLAAQVDQAPTSALVDDLRSHRFEKRHKAFDEFIRRGTGSIDVLVQAANTDDFELGTRCVAALVQIARNKRDPAACLKALEQIQSQSPSSSVATLAAEELRRLRTTSEEKVVAALEDCGLEIRRGFTKRISVVTLKSDFPEAYLEFLPELRSVGLVGKGVTDAALGSVSRLESLRSLSLYGTSRTDNGLRKLRHSRLTSLSIHYESLSVDGIRWLSEMDALDRFSLSMAESVDAAWLETLVGIPQLRSLTLRLDEPTAETIKVLHELKHLDHLSIVASELTDAHCKLLKHLEPLKNLSISRSRDITDDGLVSLKDVRNLRRLLVAKTNVTQDGAESLKQLLLLLRDVSVC